MNIQIQLYKVKDELWSVLKGSYNKSIFKPLLTFGKVVFDLKKVNKCLEVDVYFHKGDFYAAAAHLYQSYEYDICNFIFFGENAQI